MQARQVCHAVRKAPCRLQHTILGALLGVPAVMSVDVAAREAQSLTVSTSKKLEPQKLVEWPAVAKQQLECTATVGINDSTPFQIGAGCMTVTVTYGRHASSPGIQLTLHWLSAFHDDCVEHLAAAPAAVQPWRPNAIHALARCHARHPSCHSCQHLHLGVSGAAWDVVAAVALHHAAAGDDWLPTKSHSDTRRQTTADSVMMCFKLSPTDLD